MSDGSSWLLLAPHITLFVPNSFSFAFTSIITCSRHRFHRELDTHVAYVHLHSSCCSKMVTLRLWFCDDSIGVDITNRIDVFLRFRCHRRWVNSPCGALVLRCYMCKSMHRPLCVTNYKRIEARKSHNKCLLLPKRSKVITALRFICDAAIQRPFALRDGVLLC